MPKFLLFLAVSTFLKLCSFGQKVPEKMIYFIDSIAVPDDPDYDNELPDSEISEITVVKNRDTLLHLGYGMLDGAVYIFTKEYRKRPDSLKLIPSTKQMKFQQNSWYFKQQAYNGRYIDYYLSGKKQAAGTLLNGQPEGYKATYYQNGNLALEQYFIQGIENGITKAWYENGKLKYQGAFAQGKKEGVWQIYYPNGIIKQQSIYTHGELTGASITFNSGGDTLLREVWTDGKPTPDKKYEKIWKLMMKANTYIAKDDLKNAFQQYSKLIELDQSFAEAYEARGIVLLNARQYDDAIADFDKALLLEPFLEKAFANRAFTRIRKYQFKNPSMLYSTYQTSVVSAQDQLVIPDSELNHICKDLKQALFLGEKGKLLMDSLKKFCSK